VTGRSDRSCPKISIFALSLEDRARADQADEGRGHLGRFEDDDERHLGELVDRAEDRREIAVERQRHIGARRAGPGRQVP